MAIMVAAAVLVIAVIVHAILWVGVGGRLEFERGVPMASRGSTEPASGAGWIAATRPERAVSLRGAASALRRMLTTPTERLFGKTWALVVRAFIPRDIAECDPAYRRYLDAIRTHESEGGKKLVGDEGASLGPLHIGYKCWVEGCEELGVRWPWWPFALSRRHSERVITAYYAKYAPAALLAGDWAVLARVHNGGPDGPHKPHTLAYWKKIEGIMERDAHGTLFRQDVGISSVGIRWHGGMRPANPPADHRFRGGRLAAAGTMRFCEAKEFYWEATTPLFVEREYD